MADVSDVSEALRSRGFVYKGVAPDGRLQFRGSIDADGTAITCELGIDAELFELPTVTVLNVSEVVHQKITPHLSSGGDLCFVARGSVVLDIFDPVGQTLACLERAQVVLAGALRGEYVEDLEHEFAYYWDGPPCLLDIQDMSARVEALVVPTEGGRLFGAVTDDRARTERKLSLLGMRASEASWSAFRVRTQARPRPDRGTWPPRTVGDFLQWQGRLDLGTKRYIEKKLQQALESGAVGAAVVVESPLVTYCIGVRLWESISPPKQGAKTKTWLYSRALLTPSTTRIDDRFIAERNSPGMRTLAGKRIVLVGAGTIGGYLGDMLARAGAGTGGGELVVIDPDALLAENLGRHRLGFNYLFQPKATALCVELSGTVPGAKATPVLQDVKEVSLERADLLIDATGEEALGHWLCKNRLLQPMLTVWVEGPGTAVRALLHTSRKGACFRCLCDANKRGELRVSTEATELLLAGNSCDGLYVPFGAHVSVQAASLAAEMVLAWCNDAAQPALRTRVLDQSISLATADCSPPVNEDCPACSM